MTAAQHQGSKRNRTVVSLVAIVLSVSSGSLGIRAAAPAPTPTIEVVQVAGGPAGARMPTRGALSATARAEIPDFVPILAPDGVRIAGWAARIDLDRAITSVPWWYQEPPIPVYADDLVTLVGFMLPDTGFVDFTVVRGPDAPHSAGPSSEPLTR